MQDTPVLKGEVVDPQRPAMVLVKNDPLWVHVHLPSAQSSQLKIGQDLGVVEDHAARALDQGLDEDGGDLAGPFGEQPAVLGEAHHDDEQDHRRQDPAADTTVGNEMPE